MLARNILLEQRLLPVLDIYPCPVVSAILAVAHFVVDPKSMRTGEPSSEIIMLLPVSDAMLANLRRLDISMRIRHEFTSVRGSQLLVAVKDDLVLTMGHQGHRRVPGVSFERSWGRLRWIR